MGQLEHILKGPAHRITNSPLPKAYIHAQKNIYRPGETLASVSPFKSEFGTPLAKDNTAGSPVTVGVSHGIQITLTGDTDSIIQEVGVEPEQTVKNLESKTDKTFIENQDEELLDDTSSTSTSIDIKVSQGNEEQKNEIWRPPSDSPQLKSIYDVVELVMAINSSEHRLRRNTAPSIVSELYTSPLPPITDTHAVLQEVKNKLSKDERNMVEGVIDVLVKVHYKTCKLTYRNFHLYKFREEPDNFKSTRASFTEYLIKLSKQFEDIIHFFKGVPGFTDLILSDQKRLLKCGIYTTYSLRNSVLFLKKDFMLLDDITSKVPIQVNKNLKIRDFLPEQAAFSQEIIRANLNEEEIAILSCIALFSLDYPGRQNRKGINRLQQLYIQCLFTYYQNNKRGEVHKRFAERLALVPKALYINEQFREMCESLRHFHPEMTTTLPFLVKEIGKFF